MAATNYTPIQLYRSTTASAVPLAANLAAGELALNIVDGKLYYNDSGTVKLLASNAATTNVSTISFGTTGLTPSTATSGAVTVAGTLVVGNGGTGLTTITAGRILFGAGTSAILRRLLHRLPQARQEHFRHQHAQRPAIKTRAPRP